MCDTSQKQTLTVLEERDVTLPEEGLTREKICLVE